MSARKLLQELESQGLLDDAIISDLRRQVDGSSRSVNAETIAKLLVDNGHLTKFQATKLVSDVTAPAEKKRSERSAKKRRKRMSREESESAATAVQQDELGLADDEGDEGDEVVMLEDASSAAPPATPPTPPPPPPAGGLQPLSGGLQPLGGAEPLGGGLEPQGSGGLEPMGGGLEPMGGGGLEPLGGDPFGGADEQAPQEEQKKRGPKKKLRRDNVWDSPLLFVGGGLLLLLLFAGTYLLLSLTRGTAEEMFQKAEEDYRNQSYTQAVAKYTKFLKKYSGDPNASLAHVRIGMAEIRTAVENSSDPQKGLDEARQQLPAIENEEAFDTARPELSSLLPEIARKFAEKADNAASIPEAEGYLGKVDEAMELVNNASYIPTSERKKQAARLQDIVELSEKVRRQIGRDRSLSEAVSAIRTAVVAGNTTEAYQARKTLLKKYRGLETHPDLVAAVDEITTRAQSLVGTEETQAAPVIEDRGDAPAMRVLLASYGGKSLPGADKHLALAKVDGAVYGVDAGTGRVRWRRFVGYDTALEPITLSPDAGADALVVDGLRQELLRLKAENGDVVWRLPLGEEILAPNISADGTRVVVATRSGRVMEINADTGQPSIVARIPQELSVGPGVGDARRPLIYQPADHDNLYVLENDSLVCKQVYHIGHKAGMIAVPPVMAVGHIFVAVNAFPGRSLLYVLAGNSSGLELTEAQPAIALEGHVVTPIMVTGRRIVVVTDLGAVTVLDVAPQKEDAPPVSPAVKPRVATFQQPTRTFPLVDNLHLWIGDNRLARYEIQTAKGEMQQMEIENQGDAFVGPMRHVARGVLHLRRPKGSPGVTMRAVNDRKIKETIWTAELGVPAATMIVDGQRIFMVSGRGQLYPVGAAAVQQGYAEPTSAPPAKDNDLFFEFATKLAGGQTVVVSRSRELLLFEPGSSQLQARRLEAASGTVAAAPVAMGPAMVVPLSSGQVIYCDARGSSLAQPFQPQLEVNSQLQWMRPAAVAEDRFVIADSRQKLYLVGVNTRGAKHLALLQERTLADQVISPLAFADGKVWCVIRGVKNDTLLSFAADSLEPGPTIPLNGRMTWGPQASGDSLYIGSTGDGLICYGPDQSKQWQLPLDEDRLAGPPEADGDSLLVATVGGRVLRIENGRVTQSRTMSEPLGTAPHNYNGRILVGGADGTLLVTSLEDAASTPAEAQAAVEVRP